MLPLTRCADGCGREAQTKPENEGWTSLQITGRWRCPTCALALERVNAKCAVEAPINPTLDFYDDV